MENLSFFEKLGILFSNIFAHPIFIGLLLLPVLLIIFNKKITRKVFVFIYIGVLLVVLFVGNTVIFNLFDNMVDGLFMTLYFPNFITLFIVEVISFVITLITFFKKVKKVNKIINITSFAVIQTLFCLVLTVIKTNNIDIYKENALYSNNDVLTIMQLLMGMFALQVISLVVIYLIDKITLYLDNKDKVSSNIQEKLDYVKETRNQRTPIITPASYKEPEVVITPQKPLDKSLIKEKKIDSIDLEEEVSKEEVLESKKDVISFDDFKLEYPDVEKTEVKPSIDDIVEKKSDEVIVSNDDKKVDIKKPDLLRPMEEVSKEESSIDDIVEEKSDEVIVSNDDKRVDIKKPDLLRPMEEVSKEESSIDDIVEEKSDEVIVSNDDKKVDIKKPDLLRPMEEVSKAESLEKENLKGDTVKFNDFKLEYPDAKTKATKAPIPSLETLDAPIINLKAPSISEFDNKVHPSSLKKDEIPVISNNTLDNKKSIKHTTIEDEGISLEDILPSDVKVNENNTLVENVPAPVLSSQGENVSSEEGPTELIVNLRIINFEKMVDIISKLKRVYTL